MLAGVVATCAAPGTDRPATPLPAGDRGPQLYQQHCAACHGADGRADTPVAALLLPRPNAFADGRFKLVSTGNGMPSEQDLVATLRRGMPGSTMMAYDWLPDTDLSALAQHVRALAVRGRAEAILRTAAFTGAPLTPAAATALAERELAAGPTVPVPAVAAPNDATLSVGQALYHRHCAACHGDDGRGLPHAATMPTDGTWLWPRDFTAGYLRGDASHRALAFRILAGMPGAHMPPTPLAEAEAAALLAYVQSLIPEPADRRHVQWRRTVRVGKVAELPFDAAAWAVVETVRLPAVPVHWRADAASELQFAAVHDGATLAVRLQWADPTRSDRLTPGRALGDGVALQWTAAEAPPLLAMGQLGEPVNVWRWHAYDPKETAGFVDLLRSPPADGTPVVRNAPRAESAQFHGIFSVGDAVASGWSIDATPHWHGGVWTVEFRRALAARGAGEVGFAAGGARLFAVALWDGARDDHAATKTITTWHRLELLP